MAGYKEHITFSSCLGIGLGATSHFLLGFSPVEASLSGFLTAFAGMLPDLDSQSSRPVRDLFAMLGAVVPLFVMGRIMRTAGVMPSTEALALTFIVLYHIIRFGGMWLIGKLAVHRGMFHSIPAMLIAMLLTYMAAEQSEHDVRMLLALSIGLGFFSHLLLDEIWAIQIRDGHVRLNKFSGTAIKWVGQSQSGNLVTYGIMFALSYTTLIYAGVIQPQPVLQQVVTPEEVAPELTLEPVLQQAAEFPRDVDWQ